MAYARRFVVSNGNVEEEYSRIFKYLYLYLIYIQEYSRVSRDNVKINFHAVSHNSHKLKVLCIILHNTSSLAETIDNGAV